MDSLTHNISFYSYMLASVLTIFVGVVYAFRSQIMPYHLKALQTSWEEIDPKYQFMLKALLNGGGYYGISSGLFMLTLLMIPYRDEQLWAGYAIGLIGLVGALPLGYIVYSVKKYTEGNPPLWVMVVVNLLLIIGFLAIII